MAQAFSSYLNRETRDIETARADHAAMLRRQLQALESERRKINDAILQAECTDARAASSGRLGHLRDERADVTRRINEIKQTLGEV